LQAEIMSGLILISELLLVPLCVSLVVAAIAWFQRNADDSPRRRQRHRPAH
jgi:hypothetical protein